MGVSADAQDSILLTNHQPHVTGTDEGIWRRLRLVPFEVTFWDPDKHPDPVAEGLDPELRQDKHLRDKLAAEAPGILAWWCKGCLDWRRDGLTTPAEVRAATARYREAEDVLAQFLAERCVTGPRDIRCRRSELYGAYGAWCETAGEKPLSGKSFGDAMTERGFERVTSNGVWYLGVALRQQSETEGAEPDAAGV